MSQVAAISIQKTSETSLLERLSYTAYFAGQNVVYNMITTYLAVYYISFQKISPALVATILLTVRLWDAVNDPIIGVMMDRIKLRGSRYKMWIGLAAIAMPISTFLLFTVPSDSSAVVRTIYIIITYVLWDVFYTISEVPIFAISTSMTRNEHERTKLLTLTQIGSILGVVLGMVAITALLGDGIDNVNWPLMAGIPVALAILFMIPAVFYVKERHNTQVIKEASLGEMLRDILRNDQHLLMMLFYVSQMFLNAMAVFAPYVAEAFYGDARYSTIISAFALLGVLGLGALTPMIVKKYGKQKYLEASMVVTLVLSIPIFFIPGDLAIVALIFLGLRTATLIVTSILRPMFTADCIEYGQQKTGIRSDSTAFAIQTFFNKTGDALGTSLGGFVLAWVGFNEAIPLAQQSLSTINSLQLWMVVLPMIMALIMWLGPKFFYKLNETKVLQYIEANEKGNSAAAAFAVE
jgi:glycoside/pentoside/hexuronide:cation symporter, GPH family